MVDKDVATISAYFNTPELRNGMTAANYTNFSETLESVLSTLGCLEIVTGEEECPLSPEDTERISQFQARKRDFNARKSKAELVFRRHLGEAANVHLKNVPIGEQWAKLKSTFEGAAVGDLAACWAFKDAHAIQLGDHGSIDKYLTQCRLAYNKVNEADLAEQRANYKRRFKESLPKSLEREYLPKRHHARMIYSGLPQNLAEYVNIHGRVDGELDVEAMEEALRNFELDTTRRVMEPQLDAPSTFVAGVRSWTPAATKGSQLRSQPRRRGGAAGHDPSGAWPAGINPATDRFRVADGQCWRCFGFGHISKNCPITERHKQGEARSAVLAKYGIHVDAENTYGLIAEIQPQTVRPGISEAEIEAEDALERQAPPHLDAPTETAGMAAATVDVTTTDATSDVNAFLASDSKPSRFILDSGATRHMTECLHLLSDYRQFTTPLTIGGAFNSKGIGLREGKMTLSIGQRPLTLHNVLYAPNLGTNLVSSIALSEAGYDILQSSARRVAVVIDGNGAKIAKFSLVNRQMVAEASALNVIISSPTALTTITSADLVTWHQRMAHAKKDRLLDLVTSLGLRLPANVKDALDAIDRCEGCLLGKGSHHPNRAEAESRAVTPLVRVFVDLWGPSSVPALSGHRYLVGFTDDASRRRWVVGVHRKSEAVQKIKDFIAYVERQDRRDVIILRTDNGGEFVNTSLASYLAGKGIRGERALAYEHGQMGVQERGWRTIFDDVRAMLCSAKLPLALWEEAANAAVFAENLLPTRSNGGRSPMAVYNALAPDVGGTRQRTAHVDRIRAWGCVAYTTLPADARGSKLLPRRRLARFVGYSHVSKAWRFYDPMTKSVYKASHAIFHEDTFAGDATRDDQAATRMWRMAAQDSAADGTVELEEEIVEPQIPGLDLHGASDNEPVSAPPPLVPVLPAAAPEGYRVIRTGPNPGRLENVDPGNILPEGSRRHRASIAFALFAPHDPFDGEIIDPDTAPDEYAFLASTPTDSPTYKEAMSGVDRARWLEAIATEEEMLRLMGTFSEPLTAPADKRPIKAKWVLAVKRDGAGNIEKYKARLVARGDMQQEGIDYTNTWSPTGRPTSHRILLALAVEHEWETRQFDISSAYLNGNLKEEVYMRLPNGDVVRVLRTLYGLCQAGHEWNAVFHAGLVSLGWSRCEHDHAVYWRLTSAGRQYISGHVDDGMVTGAGNLDDIITEISTKFTARNLGAASNFLGMLIKREGRTGAMTVTQSRLIEDLLGKYDLLQCKAVDTAVAEKPNETHEPDKIVPNVGVYRRIVGVLNFLAGCTRPDIAFAVGKAARFCNEPKSYHWEALWRILRYLKGTMHHGLFFTKQGASPTTSVEGWVDADHAGDKETRRSVTGYVFKLGGGAVSWIAKRQPLVTLSSTEAEYVAMSYAVRESVWLRMLLEELGFQADGPTAIHGDNRSAITLVGHPAFHPRTKHIGVHWHYSRDQQGKGAVILKWVPTRFNLADGCTKGLAATRQAWFRSAIGVVDANLEEESWRDGERARVAWEVAEEESRV